MKEVYVARGVDGEVLYVGQGNIGRNVHCLNGTSHNKHLNRYFFQNGEDGCITTEVLHIVDEQEDAERLEKQIIKELQPIFNICLYDGVARYKSTKPIMNFKYYAKLVYDNFDVDKEKVYSVFTMFPNIEDYVRVLGLDTLRSCSFQESKIKKKFMSVVGAKELESNRSGVRDILNLKKGEWYSLKLIKEKLKQTYSKLDYKCKAFASDIDKFYATKRSVREGVEGVVILDKA